MKNESNTPRLPYKTTSCRHRLLGALIVGGFTVTALGESVTYNSAVSMRPSPSSQLLAIPKFDPGLGTLNSIDVQLDGVLRCSARAENLESVSRTLTVGAFGTMEILNSNYTHSYLSVAPTVTYSLTVSAYDGVTDYAGPGGSYGSGFVVDPPLSANGVTSLHLVSSDSAFADFVGAGDIQLGAMNDAVPIAFGASPMSSQISVDVGSSLQITYNYTPTGAAIGGQIWTDVNQNGSPDPTEPGIPGITVTLLDIGGQLVNVANNPQTTSTNGNYLFTGLDVPPSQGYEIYTVVVTPPAGGTQTYDYDDGASPTPTTPNSSTIVVLTDQYTPGVSYGYTPENAPPVCSTPLSITCPPARTVPYNGAPIAARTKDEFIGQGGTITGACGVVTVTSTDLISGSCPVHITRTYTVKDNRNVAVTCQQQITMNNLFKIGDIIWHQPLSRNGAADDTDPSAGGTLKYRFKQGSTIPIQIHLYDCNGTVVSSYANVMGKVQVFGDANCNGIADGNDVLIDYNGVGGASGLMDKVGPFLKYNIDTKTLPASLSCYILKVTVTDTSTGETVSENVPLQSK